MWCVFFHAGENKQLYGFNSCGDGVGLFFSRSPHYVEFSSMKCMYNLHVNNSIEYYSDLSNPTLAFYMLIHQRNNTLCVCFIFFRIWISKREKQKCFCMQNKSRGFCDVHVCCECIVYNKRCALNKWQAYMSRNCKRAAK